MCLIIKVKNPELVLAEGAHEGFEWIVTNNGIGFRCGYVRVPSGHPWHGKDDSQIDAIVHGGLTFSHADHECGRGGAEDGWWIGFDCAHYGDGPDPDLPGSDKMSGWYGGAIRTQGYVELECRSLCEQAKEAACRTGI